MSQPNPHQVMNEAWSKVLTAVVANRLQPLTVAQYLNLLVEGGPTKTIQALSQLAGDTQLFMGRLKESLAIIEDNSNAQGPLKVLATSVHDNSFGLGVRARKGLRRLGIETVGDLIARNAHKLLELKNFGVTSLNEVREKLAKHGLKLRDD